MSQQYYRKPTAMGGGGNEFTGWLIPTTLQSTANGSYSAVVTATDVTLTGIGNEIGNDGTGSI